MPTVHAEGDGYILKTAIGGTWATVRDSTTGTATSNKTKYHLAVAAYQITGFITIPSCTRTFIRFDSSGITDSLSAATLNIYGYTTSTLGGDTVGDDEDFWVLKSNANFGLIGGEYFLNSGHYDGITGWDTSSPTTDGSGNGDQSDNVTLYSGMYDISGGWDTSGYNSITLTAQARADLVSLDTFVICIMSDDDLKDTPDNLSFGSVVKSMGMYFMNETGTSKDPYIDFTVATEAVTHSATFFGCNF